MYCYHCGKGVMFGRSHTHHRGVAGGRWKKRAQKTQRLFMPNLQPTMIIEKGKTMRVKLCNKCLKRIKKDVLEGEKPFLKLVHMTVVPVSKDKKADKKADIKTEKKVVKKTDKKVGKKTVEEPVAQVPATA